jgi:arsenate reductase
LPDEIKNNLTDEVMFAAVLEQPTLLKRPLLPLNDTLNLGFKAEQYQALFSDK